jgi:hypothetical protein
MAEFEIEETLSEIDDLPQKLICDLCHQPTKKLNKLKHHSLEICDNCLEEYRKCD